MPRYKPMLASAGAIRGEPGDYSFEPKLDGWRALVTVAGGQVQVRTRNGHDVTASVPELEGMRQHFLGRSVVLDGELVAHKGTPSSFYRLSGRMAAKRPSAVRSARQRTPATFVAFDVLWHDGDVTAQPYTERSPSAFTVVPGASSRPSPAQALSCSLRVPNSASKASLRSG